MRFAARPPFVTPIAAPLSRGKTVPAFASSVMGDESFPDAFLPERYVMGASGKVPRMRYTRLIRDFQVYCPECQSDNHHVIDSRKSGEAIRRRRSCSACFHRWTTFETTNENRNAPNTRFLTVDSKAYYRGSKHLLQELHRDFLALIEVSGEMTTTKEAVREVLKDA